jgi:tetratricopeptide (TPR) repeat protein
MGRFAFLFAACFLALAAPASATTRMTGLTADQLFNLASELQQGGNPEDAESIYEALAHDREIDIRNEARFRHAQLLTRLNRLTEAAVLYRAILDERPDVARVRLELAALMAQMGDLRGARGQLRQAQAGGLPPDVAQIVNRYVAALRSLKPWGGTFELAITPDSNINRATDAKVLDTVIAPLNLSSDARETSGVGLKSSSQLYARADLGNAVTLVPRLSGEAELFRAEQFNDISVSAQLGVEWRTKSDRVTPSAGQTWRWYGGSLYARTRNATLDWLHPAGRRGQITVNLGLNHARYVRNAIQSGMIYNMSASYEHAFSAKAGGSISVSGVRQTARDEGYSTASGQATLLFWRDLGKITVFVSATQRILEADKRLFLYPKRRSDHYARLGIGGVFRQVQLAGFSPVLRAGIERNWSSVGLYDYRRFATDIGISRAF